MVRGEVKKQRKGTVKKEEEGKKEGKLSLKD